MKAADQAVRDLAAVCGVPFGHYATSDSKPEPIEGNSRFEAAERYAVEREDGTYFVTLPSGLVADHNPTYGGYVIEQIADNGRTWIGHPFKQERLHSARFCAYVSELIERILADDSLADHVRRDLQPESDRRKATI